MNRMKMIVLNLILLAGITTSIGTAFAGIQNDGEASGSTAPNQTDSSGTEQYASVLGGPCNDGNDNCTYTPVVDGCAVCAGCNGQCSL